MKEPLREVKLSRWIATQEAITYWIWPTIARKVVRDINQREK